MVSFTDQKFNSCTAPEEDSSDLSDSQEYVYAAYAPGAIVWAKITGYPWYVRVCVCVCACELLNGMVI